MIRLSALPAWCLAIAFAMGLAVAVPAAAQTIGDADRDGVGDVVDLCPATPLGDLIDTQGCSACPCDAAWASHQAYVDCVSLAANQQYLAGLISRTRTRGAISGAKNSTCGTTSTRCCTWRKLVYGSLGSCTVMDPAKCSYAVIGKWAENRGPGSCYFNPCTW